MLIRLIAIGQKMPGWIEHGFGEYAKRIKGDLKLELVELPMQKRGKSTSSKKLSEVEGQALLASLKAKDYVAVLDVKGNPVSTEQLAKRLLNWQQQGRSIAFLVGGPDGLSPAVLARADVKLSLSALTLPHPLVRVIIAEQLYRAWSINQGHPYHR